MLTRLLLSLSLTLPVSALAQSTELTPAQGSTEVSTNSEVVVGGILGADDDESAKFNEYRDITDGFRIFNFRLLQYAPSSGLTFEGFGTNLGGDDQSVSFQGGRPGVWSAGVAFDAIPHRLTNNAQSPYSYAGNGLFTVPSVVGILTTTPTGSTFLPSDMLENDRRIAGYLDENLHPLSELGTENETLSVDLKYAPSPAFEAKLYIARETREGEKISYGVLGDRPPRSLNVELPEPIDYSEDTYTFDLAWAGQSFDATLEVYAPSFDNDVETMQWQSMFYGPDADGALDYNNDVILAGDAIVRRAMSTVGQRALAPDNDLTSTTLSFGMDTSMNGRLSATVSLGQLRQDMTLLPYSYSTLTTNWNSTSKLPRTSAEAAMDTFLADLQYVFNPAKGVRVRTFVRSYILDNDTATDNWWYVTQDTANSTTGSAGYKNKRTNLAYGYERQNIGAEGTWQINATNLGLLVEQESMDRDFREADTDEQKARLSASYRPSKRLTVRGHYLYGQRDADGYDISAALGSYWYAAADAGTDPDNPKFSFQNHPDMRRYDVSDRERNEIDLRATFNATPDLSFSASFTDRSDDFDSDVTPVQPLAGTNFGGASGITPGIQLGLIEQDVTRYSFDANWVPSERFSANAFVSIERIESVQRSMAYNEATRTNAQTPLLASAGQAWTDARSIWTAQHEDQSDTFGVGFSYAFIPERLTLTADYSYANGTVGIDYSGYGSDKPLTTTYYAWTSPTDVEHVTETTNINLEYQLPRGFMISGGYLLEDYDVDDWMQEPKGGWVESVNDYFVRDSTRDNRWGNRLVRLGGYLAPSYSVSVGFVKLGYRW
ncbi:MAG: MtrB/PioB family outer membrane beta-barrel protein [Acidobacteria bacterium]|nr:MtrB/PioB family outer membrane beta-barrel protein [Acidobacteriota bacterium]